MLILNVFQIRRPFSSLRTKEQTWTSSKVDRNTGWTANLSLRKNHIPVSMNVLRSKNLIVQHEQRRITPTQPTQNLSDWLSSIITSLSLVEFMPNMYVFYLVFVFIRFSDQYSSIFLTFVWIFKQRIFKKYYVLIILCSIFVWFLWF